MPTDAPGAAASLGEWLRWQETLHPRSIALGLERVAEVAKRLALPQTDCTTVTVAGTNGKGSCVAILSEIYRAAGWSVGAYTSPHLVRYNERIEIDGEPVGDAPLCAAFARVEAARAGVPLTFFEFGTLAALLLFRERRVEVQLLEVGLGGRLDAVNIVDADVALITTIGTDHQDYLGHDREQIGREKAGILRGGRPAVCADRDPPESIAAFAREIGAPLWRTQEQYRFAAVADAWNWTSGAVRWRKLPPPGVTGAVQLDNAAAAIAVVTLLQERVPVAETAIRAGLMRYSLPGRFEIRGNVILDVAHNVEAAHALAENLQRAASAPVHMVLGMLADKPVEAFARILAAGVDRVYAGGLPGPRGLSGAELGGRLGNAGIPVEVFETVNDAFDAARRRAGRQGIVLVCGSFLTVGSVMEKLNG